MYNLRYATQYHTVSVMFCSYIPGGKSTIIPRYFTNQKETMDTNEGSTPAFVYDRMTVAYEMIDYAQMYVGQK